MKGIVIWAHFLRDFISRLHLVVQALRNLEIFSLQKFTLRLLSHRLFVNRAVRLLQRHFVLKQPHFNVDLLYVRHTFELTRLP